MKNSDPDSRTSIPKEQMTAWERWELPLLDERGREVVTEKEVKPLTAADLEEIRQAAREDGFQEGRAAGYQEGFGKGQEEGYQEGFKSGQSEGREQGSQQAADATRKDVELRMERLEQLMAELVSPIERHQDELESALVNLSTGLARAVVYRELTIDSSQIHQVVRQALSALPANADNLRIHLHPDDLEPVQEVIARLETAPAIIEDSSLMPGGCKVESRHSLVDFTVEKRFQRAVQGMLDDQLEDSPEADGDNQEVPMADLTEFHRDLLSDSAMTQGPARGGASDATPEQQAPQTRQDDSDELPGS